MDRSALHFVPHFAISGRADKLGRLRESGFAIMTNEPGRSAGRFFKPFWLFLAAGLIVVAAGGVRFVLPVYRQQLAVHRIEQLGGIVLTKDRAPDWLRDWVGADRVKPLDAVVEVKLRAARASSQDLAVLQWLPELVQLNLAETPVTDSGMVYLRGLTQLEELNLSRTKIGDGGLGHLAGMARLRTLWLDHNPIADAGLASLAGLPSLKALNLARTKVTRDGVRELKRKLRGLRVQY